MSLVELDVLNSNAGQHDILSILISLIPDSSNIITSFSNSLIIGLFMFYFQNFYNYHIFLKGCLSNYIAKSESDIS